MLIYTYFIPSDMSNDANDQFNWEEARKEVVQSKENVT